MRRGTILKQGGREGYFLIRMDNLHIRLKVELGRKNKIFYYNSKEHLKISKIAKFGEEMS